MKTLFAFLMAISCTALVSAQSSNTLYKGDFTFPIGLTSSGAQYTPICYRYALNGAATPGEVNEPLAKNEIFRVCLVRDKRVKWDEESRAYLPNVTNVTLPAVAVDAAGQLVCADCGTTNFAQHLTLEDDSACAGNAVDAKWMTLTWTPLSEDGEATTSVVSEFAKVGDVLGAPSNKIADIRSSDHTFIRASYYGFNVFTTEDLVRTSDVSYVYVYLVALDTRNGEGVCEGFPKHVKSYAMSLCPGSKSADKQYVVPTDLDRSWAVGATIGQKIPVFWPGAKIAWKPASVIKSLVVTKDDGTQETLTGDDLADHLKPKVNSFVQDVDEDGNPVLNLAVTAPDVQYYTLYTKANLSEGTWERFSDFVENSEKVLDKTIGKYYTRFRIDGESPLKLKIPVLTGETSRFYQLRGE